MRSGSARVTAVTRRPAALVATLLVVAAAALGALPATRVTARAAAQPVVSAISPTSGPVNGGTKVFVVGSSFTGATDVLFGNRSASSFHVDSDNQVTAISPDSTVAAGGAGPGIVDIVVVVGGAQSATSSADQFKLEPEVLSVTPNVGPATGGTSVAITGFGFQYNLGHGNTSSGDQVCFGDALLGGCNAPLTAATINDDGSITATAPPQSPGTVAVYVIVNSVRSLDTGTEDQFTYTAGPGSSSPNITNVDTHCCVASRSVTILGTNFNGNLHVYFGFATCSSQVQVAATFTVNGTGTQITAVAPDHVAAAVDIVVVNDSGNSGCNPGTDGYTYDVPNFSGLNPTTGPSQGGTQVQISGGVGTDAFDTDSRQGAGTFNGQVFFDDGQNALLLCGPCTVTGGKIVVTTPPHAAGPVTTTGDNSAGNATGNPTFSYFALQPVVSAVTPNYGASSGGNSVVLTGQNFTAATSVTFDTTNVACPSVKCSVDSDTQVTVVVPAHGAGTVDVKVTTGGGTSDPTNDTTGCPSGTPCDQYTYVPPTVSKVSTSQYSLADSNGTTWTPIDPNLDIHVSPTQDQAALLTANADLWTATAGYNQDLAIIATDNGGVPTLLAWKESGGFAGTFSPNAAFVQWLYPMTHGHNYVFKLGWKTNKPTSGSSLIYAGAGSGPYSPTSLTAQFYPGGAAPNFAFSRQQYQLVSSTGMVFVPIDATNLSSTITPPTDSTAVLGANVDLWTSDGGVNQDVAIYATDITAAGSPTLVAWKESGGFAGTFSPNAAFVKATYPMTGGHQYKFDLRWKTNKSAAGETIWAGAGPINSQYSPTDLFVQAVPNGAYPQAAAIDATQPTLKGSDGATWQALAGMPTVTVTPVGNSNVILGGNADLFTDTSGYNQDLAIFMSDNGGADQLVAWKESGGFAGTFSPNAAMVQSLVSLTGGHTYVFTLKWKTNRNAPGVTIYAGAGPFSGKYSPTRLTAELVP